MSEDNTDNTNINSTDNIDKIKVILSPIIGLIIWIPFIICSTNLNKYGVSIIQFKVKF